MQNITDAEAIINEVDKMRLYGKYLPLIIDANS